jgi:putative Holliday junction resolvase
MLESGAVLAFDFGEKRIGVAVGDLALKIAHPLATIAHEDNMQRFAAIEALFVEWRPAVLAVGLPTYLDGQEHEMTRLCRKFAQRLRARYGLPVVLVDERLTSHSAEAALAESGVHGRKRRAALDQVAAQHILQTFFEMGRHAAA